MLRNTKQAKRKYLGQYLICQNVGACSLLPTGDFGTPSCFALNILHIGASSPRKPALEGFEAHRAHESELKPADRAKRHN